MTLDPLSRIAQRTGTDKWWLHGYTEVYHRHFAPLRERPLRLLEIGVGGAENPAVGGHSLRMWREYFPNATIVGIDIHDKAELAGDRIVIERGSQSDPGFMRALCDRHGPFDIVIDDGSHLSDDVVCSLTLLWERLPDGAIYAIEDIQCAFDDRFACGHGPDSPELSVNVLKRLVDTQTLAPAGAGPDAGPGPFAGTVSAIHFHPNLVLIEKGRVPRRDALAGGSEWQLAHALAALEEALGEEPDDAGLHYLRSVVLSRQKRHPDALAPAHRAVKLAPGNPEYWHHFGNLQFLLGRIPASIASQQEAIRLSAGNPHFHAALGRALTRAGRLEEALAEFERAAGLMPERPEFHRHVAWVRDRLAHRTARPERRQPSEEVQ